MDVSTRATFFAFSRSTGCSKLRIGRRATRSILPARTSISSSLRHRVDVVAPAPSARREVSGALQTAAFQRHLPPVLAPQAVDEGRRRPHHANPFDTLPQEAARELLRGLSR